jgi:amidase
LITPRTLLVWLLATSPLSASAADQWIVAIDLWGTPSYQTLDIEVQGARVAGTLGGDPLSGTLRAGRLQFTATGRDGERQEFEGRIDGGRMRGESELPDTNDPKARAHHAFSARRVPTRSANTPRQHVHTPTDYSNTFSADRAPVLVVWPGDSIQTSTLDSGGVDEHGVTRALFGNPQVGPFFVVGAEPGDTLAVTLSSLKLNRDYADSLDGLVGRLQTPRVASEAGGLGKHVRWTLDRERGVAHPQDASGALKAFEVPVRPMLGGIALAPGFGAPPLSTGDTDRFGGNMDFNAVVEGNTVYLPVQQPGALLYLGDGHALQGDGETTQWALETSLDVVVRVELLKHYPIVTPRVESATQIMTLGQAGSADDALRIATAGMLQWLRQAYAVDLSEATQVLGVAVHYQVANLAGRSVGVAAKLDKSVLQGLPPATSTEQAPRAGGTR